MKEMVNRVRVLFTPEEQKDLIKTINELEVQKNDSLNALRLSQADLLYSDQKTIEELGRLIEEKRRLDIAEAEAKIETEHQTKVLEAKRLQKQKRDEERKQIVTNIQSLLKSL